MTTQRSEAAIAGAEAKPLGLICPSCLGSGREVPLDHLYCPSSRERYPQSDGIPILLDDADLRETLSASGSARDARSDFYQKVDSYLREEAPSGQWLDGMLAQAPGDGIVLEVGSGAGAFAGLGGEDYCALDYSLAHLKNHLGGYRRICASAERIPLPSGSVRFLFTVATLEHVPQPDVALREIDRVLMPGGVAYLAPAWHCRDWAAEGLPVRPYGDLTLTQKLRKALIPLRDSLIFRGASQIPWRAARRLRSQVLPGPTELHFSQLEANYDHFWMSDSDACAAIDSHEAILFLESRGYELLMPTGGICPASSIGAIRWSGGKPDSGLGDSLAECPGGTPLQSFRCGSVPITIVISMAAGEASLFESPRPHRM